MNEFFYFMFMCLLWIACLGLLAIGGLALICWLEKKGHL